MDVELVFLPGVFCATFLAARFGRRSAHAAAVWATAITVTFTPVLVLAVFKGHLIDGSLRLLLVQAAAVVVGVVIFAAARVRPRWTAVGTVVSLALVYGMVWHTPRAEYREIEELRARYPFESLEDRLPRPVPPSAAGDSNRLRELERSLDDRDQRTRALRRLHNVSVSRFAEIPDFGHRRTFQLMPPSEVDLRPRSGDAPAQQDYFRTPFQAGEVPPTPSEAVLDSLHLRGVLDFASPLGYGYVKDRKHVAGFQSHGFTKVPEAADEWKVATDDLVGLLLHDRPVVYVSEKLPRMEDLRGAPTRPLDPFEAEALAALQKGADLHTADGPDGLRVLGALRNAQQCAACHEGDRGALLGAFSYRLRPAR